ncbi:MAG: serine/threonine protein kinase [Deltaproteobacteria bacterium]|nr:serine/threonine protein kinase [Deltaproteobacteria bacterium]
MSRVCPECGKEFPDTVKRCPVDNSRTLVVDAADDLIGKTIEDRFTVKSLLGKGGMGAVYRAFQHSMDREVALKVMRRDLASNTEAVKRFFREAKAASKLNNPHTITVFDFGQTDDGLLYIVMELLHGRPLARVQKENPGPMEPSRALNIVNQVLTALADAHAIGILHRDQARQYFPGRGRGHEGLCKGPGLRYRKDSGFRGDRIDRDRDDVRDSDVHEP